MCFHANRSMLPGIRHRHCTHRPVREEMSSRRHDSAPQFLDLCLLVGCDYITAAVKGLGIATAHKLVSKHRSLDKVSPAIMKGSGIPCVRVTLRFPMLAFASEGRPNVECDVNPHMRDRRV